MLFYCLSVRLFLGLAVFLVYLGLISADCGWGAQDEYSQAILRVQGIRACPCQAKRSPLSNADTLRPSAPQQAVLQEPPEIVISSPFPEAASTVLDVSVEDDHHLPDAKQQPIESKVEAGHPEDPLPQSHHSPLFDGVILRNESTGSQPSSERYEFLPPLPKSASSAPRFNYASYLVGAKILDASSTSKSAHSLLNSDGDKYWRLPCSEPRKWVTIELGEEILMDSFAIRNAEFFAGTIHRFLLLGATRYPCTAPHCRWEELGRFEGFPVHSVQTYHLPRPTYVHIVRLVYLSHHGDNYYCTMSNFEVYGSSLIEDLKSSTRKSVLNELASIAHTDMQYHDQTEDDGDSPMTFDASSSGGSGNVLKNMVHRISLLEKNAQIFGRMINRLDADITDLSKTTVELTESDDVVLVRMDLLEKLVINQTKAIETAHKRGLQEGFSDAVIYGGISMSSIVVGCILAWLFLRRSPNRRSSLFSSPFASPNDMKPSPVTSPVTLDGRPSTPSRMERSPSFHMVKR